jgi:hypothetical protein
MTPEIIKQAAAQVLNDRGGRQPENDLVSHVIWHIGKDANKTQNILAVRAQLGYMSGEYLDTSTDSYNQKWYTLKEAGRLKYLGTRKEKMTGVVSTFLTAHGWELFKLVISFIAGGSAFAVVKNLLDRMH